MGRIELDAAAFRAELEREPQLLAEPYQIVLRRAGRKDAYGQLKELTRGRAVALADFHRLLDAGGLDEPLRARLRALDGPGYVGLAPRVCREARAAAEKELAQ